MKLTDEQLTKLCILVHEALDMEHSVDAWNQKFSGPTMVIGDLDEREEAEALRKTVFTLLEFDCDIVHLDGGFYLETSVDADDLDRLSKAAAA